MLQMSSREELEAGLKELRQKHSSLVLIPTMGGLHEGHHGLVKRAKEIPQASVVVSLWLNPLQFDDPEDLRRYPRNTSEDLELLKNWKVEGVFTPQSSWFGSHQGTFVDSPQLSQDLCGASRPGHFRGVATVVMKLFQLIRPNVAIFGKKDLQQLRIIEAMVQDFYLPITILSIDTIRDEQGLALSSRNRLLSKEAQEKARHIYASLKKTQEHWKRGISNPEKLKEFFKTELAHKPQIHLDYTEIRCLKNLTPVTSTTAHTTVLLVAAFIRENSKSIRLIDHIIFK